MNHRNITHKGGEIRDTKTLNLPRNTLFFYKNVVFPAQAEYSNFSADFRLKMFLYYSWIIAYDIPV